MLLTTATTSSSSSTSRTKPIVLVLVLCVCVCVCVCWWGGPYHGGIRSAECANNSHIAADYSYTLNEHEQISSLLLAYMDGSPFSDAVL